VPATETVPYLLYSSSADPDTTQIFSLRTAVTCIGRLDRDQADPPDAAVLHFDLPTMSARHAKIVLGAAGFELCNWEGLGNISLYEREIEPGGAHLLAHCDIFRIPARNQHVRFQFIASPDQTQVLPFEVEYERGKVYVYGTRVKLTPLEYRLIAYLHRNAGRLCSYGELISALWSDTAHYERKGSLEVLLHDVRGKLRAASAGFTFMETVRAQGIRFVV
jgi:hypothetical protein